jgi:hypothetical protein
MVWYKKRGTRDEKEGLRKEKCIATPMGHRLPPPLWTSL